jgi:ABC-type bacteriocin/lantibiotic exporter with double-glycine peptidase domain
MHTTLPALSLDHRLFQRRLLDLMLAERGALVRLGLTAIFGALIGLALPYTSRVAIDTALPDASPRLLIVVALGVVLLCAHQAWMSWIAGSTRIALSAAVERGALQQVLRALVCSDYTRLKQRDSGWMTTTLSGAGSAVQRYVDSFSTLLTQGAFALAYFIVLANVSGLVAAIVILFNLLITVVSYGLARLEAQHTRVLLERTSAQHQLLHVLMIGLASLRGLFATERLGDEWSARVRGANLAQLRCARAAAFQGTIKSVGAQVLSTGLMVWAVYQCFDQQLSIGGMIFLVSTSSGLSSSVTALIGVVVGFRGLRPHLERVDEVLVGARAGMRPAAKPVLTSTRLLVKDLWYRYSAAGRWILENHSFEVEQGSVVRLDSPSGSGKTTLLRLMAGLSEPTRGKVTIFGVDAVRARHLILYVPQHCKLFETSIRENLELLSGADHAEIARVAELTGLSRLLEKLPMGDQTMVAAQGQNLSSGQRQLIVITAAFASPRPVLLLDEATNQIDVETRRNFNWPALVAGRTVVSVEHG